MVTLGISEILGLVEAEKKRADKIEVLRKHDSKPLRDILRLSYDRNVNWLVPPGMPPLKDEGAIDQEGNLYAEWRRMYLFVDCFGQHMEMPALKRESLFIQLLESIDKKDRELLCAVKDGKMPYKSLKKDLIEEAFPGLMVGLV